MKWRALIVAAIVGCSGPSNDADAATDLIWSSDFETGDLSGWSQVQACPSGVTVVTSPVRRGKYAVKLTVADDDTNAKCLAVPTANPRAQLVGPLGLFHVGDEVFIGLSMYFPADFPTVTAWLMTHEDYGAPYGGSPTIQLNVTGDRIEMRNNVPSGIDQQIWLASEDIHKGTSWEDFVIHVLWSTDPTTGFVELWHNGVQQKFNDGETREHYATFVPTINGVSDTVYVTQYRKAGYDLGTVVLYQDDIRVGRTYASVAR